MPLVDAYLENRAQDLINNADTIRINDTDNFAVSSAVRNGPVAIIRCRPNNYVNNNITNIKLLDGAVVISEKVVNSSIDTTTDIGEFEFNFNVERG